MSTPGIPRLDFANETPETRLAAAHVLERVDSGEEMPRYMRFNLQNLGHMLP